MEPFSFPVWIYVNGENRPQDGYPYYLLIRGGEFTDSTDTPIPSSAPVFTSKARAISVGIKPPFVLVEMDREAFYDAMRSCTYVEDIVVDMGTPQASIYRIEELLSKYDK